MIEQPIAHDASKTLQLLEIPSTVFSDRCEYINTVKQGLPGNILHQAVGLQDVAPPVIYADGITPALCSHATSPNRGKYNRVRYHSVENFE